MFTTRPTLYGTRHAVSAGHYLAAAAGFAMLEAGGNAVDAGCAAGHRARRAAADEVNFAGVAPIMIRTAERHGRDHRRPRPLAASACPPTCSCASTAARSRPACCAPWCRPRPTPGSPRCATTARWASATSRRRRSARPRRLRGLRAAGRPDRAARGRLSRAGRRNAAIFLPGGRPPAGRRAVRADATSRAPSSTWPTRSARRREARRAGRARGGARRLLRGDIAATIVALPRSRTAAT